MPNTFIRKRIEMWKVVEMGLGGRGMQCGLVKVLALI